MANDHSDVFVDDVALENVVDCDTVGHEDGDVDTRGDGGALVPHTALIEMDEGIYESSTDDMEMLNSAMMDGPDRGQRRKRKCGRRRREGGSNDAPTDLQSVSSGSVSDDGANIVAYQNSAATAPHADSEPGAPSWSHDSNAAPPPCPPQPNACNAESDVDADVDVDADAVMAFDDVSSSNSVGGAVVGARNDVASEAVDEGRPPPSPQAGEENAGDACSEDAVVDPEDDVASAPSPMVETANGGAQHKHDYTAAVSAPYHPLDTTATSVDADDEDAVMAFEEESVASDAHTSAGVAERSSPVRVSSGMLAADADLPARDDDSIADSGDAVLAFEEESVPPLGVASPPAPPSPPAPAEADVDAASTQTPEGQPEALYDGDETSAATSRDGGAARGEEASEDGAEGGSTGDALPYIAARTAGVEPMTLPRATDTDGADDGESEAYSDDFSMADEVEEGGAAPTAAAAGGTSSVDTEPEIRTPLRHPSSRVHFRDTVGSSPQQNLGSPAAAERAPTGGNDSDSEIAEEIETSPYTEAELTPSQAHFETSTLNAPESAPAAPTHVDDDEHISEIAEDDVLGASAVEETPTSQPSSTPASPTSPKSPISPTTKSSSPSPRRVPAYMRDTASAAISKSTERNTGGGFAAQLRGGGDSPPRAPLSPAAPAHVVVATRLLKKTASSAQKDRSVSPPTSPATKPVELPPTRPVPPKKASARTRRVIQPWEKHPAVLRRLQVLNEQKERAQAAELEKERQARLMEKKAARAQREHRERVKRLQREEEERHRHLVAEFQQNYGSDTSDAQVARFVPQPPARRGSEAASSQDTSACVLNASGMPKWRTEPKVVTHGRTTYVPVDLVASAGAPRPHLPRIYRKQLQAGRRGSAMKSWH